jgi:Type IX secretion system protein PorV
MLFRKIVSGALLIGVLAYSSQAFAVAESAAPSLTIPPGARANGMGEAYVSVADDATAAWWNAGAMAFQKNRNLAFMYSPLVPDLASDVNYQFLGYTAPAGTSGVWGLHLIYLSYGKSIATDTEGNTLREFTSWEGALAASYSMAFGDNVGAGITLKYIRVALAPADVTQDNVEGSGSSFAVDVGTMWKLPNQHLGVGLSVTNMGPDIAFIDREQSDPLPFTGRLGVSYTPISDEISNLLVTADIEQSLVWLIDSDVDQRRSEIWHAGVEYRYVNLLAGRIGYVYDKDGDFNAATYGLGFIYKDKLSLDYANVPQATDLERVHRWSITFTF